MTVEATGSALSAHRLDWRDPAAMKPDDLVAFVKGNYTACKTRRRWWELEAEQQLRWVEGDQGICLNEEGDALVEMVDRIVTAGSSADGDGKARFEDLIPLRINGLRFNVVHRIALLFGGPANLYAQPESSDSADQDAARVQSRLLNYVWHHGDQSARRAVLTAAYYTIVTGLGVLQVCWDTSLGEHESFHPEKGENTKEFRARIAEKRGRESSDIALQADGSIWLAAGDVRWEVRTGFELSEPPRCKSIGACTWLIDTKAESMEVLQDRYGRKAVSDLRPEAHEHEFSLGPKTWLSREQVVEEGCDDVVIHTLWRPVRPWSPVGAKIVVSDSGVVLEQSPLGFKHGQLPFADLREFDSIWFRPTSTVHDLMGLQANKNRMRSQAAGHFEQCAGPKVMAEEGSILNPQALDNQDRLINCKHGSLSGGQIKPWDPPSFPGHVLNLDDKTDLDMEKIGGVHKNTAGGSEFSGQSGRHAALARQGDQQGLFVPREFFQMGVARAGSQTLWLYFQFVPSARIVSYVGHDLMPDTLEFKGEELVSQRRRDAGPHEFNVRVIFGAEFDPAQVLHRVEAMTKLGYWSPERAADAARVNRLVGEELPIEYDEESLQRRNARMENARFLKDQKDIWAALGDFNILHIEEHRRATTDERFKELFRKKPEAFLKFQAHLMAHELQEAYGELRKGAIGAQAQEMVYRDFPDTRPAPPDPVQDAPPVGAEAGLEQQPELQLVA